MKKTILEQVILEAKKRLAEEYLKLKMLEEKLNDSPGKNWEALQNAKNQQVAKQAPTQIKKDATANPAAFIKNRVEKGVLNAIKTGRDALKGAGNVMKVKYPKNVDNFTKKLNPLGSNIKRTLKNVGK